MSQDYPDTEWYMWIDSDTMIINPIFNLPFGKFKGKDLVIWGNETALLAGNGRSGAHAQLCMAFGSFLHLWRPWRGVLLFAPAKDEKCSAVHCAHHFQKAKGSTAWRGVLWPPYVCALVLLMVLK